MKWEAVTEGITVHVIPLDDFKPHALSDDCWCRPQADHIGGPTVMVHTAMDNRESYETGRVH